MQLRPCLTTDFIKKKKKKKWFTDWSWWDLWIGSSRDFLLVLVSEIQHPKVGKINFFADFTHLTLSDDKVNTFEKQNVVEFGRELYFLQLYLYALFCIYNTQGAVTFQI